MATNIVLPVGGALRSRVTRRLFAIVVAVVVAFACTAAAAEAAGVNFGPRTDYPAGDGPETPVTADFNHDGNLDLAVTNHYSSTVSVWLGDGHGGFGSKTDFPAGSNPLDVVAADFNGDGNIDLAVADYAFTDGRCGVTVLLGDGKGGFGPGIYTLTPCSSHDLVAADLNGDGKMDLIVANYGNSQVSVLLGQGDGHFTETNYTVPRGSISVAVGDFNGDGKLDMAVADWNSDYVSVLLGDGTGGFGPIHTYPTGSEPQSVTAVDVNHDGKLDLIVPNWGAQTVSVLLGDGRGADFRRGPTTSSGWGRVTWRRLTSTAMGTLT